MRINPCWTCFTYPWCRGPGQGAAEPIHDPLAAQGGKTISRIKTPLGPPVLT